VATGVKNPIAGRHMYNFFSIPGIYIDNRGQFLLIFKSFFRRFLTKGEGGIIFNSTPFLSPFYVCKTRPEKHKSANHVSIVNWVGMKWEEVIVLYSQS
jgi:hypothetical protein